MDVQEESIYLVTCLGDPLPSVDTFAQNSLELVLVPHLSEDNFSFSFGAFYQTNRLHFALGGYLIESGANAEKFVAIPYISKKLFLMLGLFIIFSKISAYLFFSVIGKMIHEVKC